ncbi:MAG TPA: hypothetical protein PLT82_03165 [Candidatus Hydrogenedens sp.]|nr:hypothetical protein [Candidatus Hydrogenedens sp.]HOL20261.1 hypothetical protein [Candidatus Hydrogenedens sp.]HPP58113.1 hypothetical protein [Candidatus Hydrogenedens sp.]
MNCGRYIEIAVCSLSIGLFLFLSTSVFAQMYNSNPSKNALDLYGGKVLSGDQLTVGGRKLKNIQPHYGGQKIDEQALYNPYLEEAFSIMGKPLLTPNPYSYPRLIQPHVYNQEPLNRNTYVPPLTFERYYAPKKDSLSALKANKRETASFSPIISALVGVIDALYHGKKSEKEGISGVKRLSLSGWYGNIQTRQGQSGSFNFRNTNGETVSGTYYMSGSQIRFNIDCYSSGNNEYWQGSSNQWGSGSSINIRGKSGSITGSSSSFGDDMYRYRFNAPDRVYDVEIRNTSKSSQTIRVTGNNTTHCGYIN